jgi:hypothetical protein
LTNEEEALDVSIIDRLDSCSMQKARIVTQLIFLNLL